MKELQSPWCRGSSCYGESQGASFTQSRWASTLPSSQVGETDVQGCVRQVQLLLLEAELEDSVSEVLATGSGHQRRAACHWFVTGDSLFLSCWSATSFWQLWLTRHSLRLKKTDRVSAVISLFIQNTVGRQAVCDHGDSVSFGMSGADTCRVGEMSWKKEVRVQACVKCEVILKDPVPCGAASTGLLPTPARPPK